MRKKGEMRGNVGRKGRKKMSETRPLRSVPIGRDYSMPYYLHVGNFAVPVLYTVNEVHKRINMRLPARIRRDAHRVRETRGRRDV